MLTLTSAYLRCKLALSLSTSLCVNSTRLSIQKLNRPSSGRTPNSPIPSKSSQIVENLQWQQQGKVENLPPPQAVVTDYRHATLNMDKLLNESTDFSTLAALLKLCCDAQALSDGRLVHAHIKKYNYDGDTFLGNWLVKLYGDCCSMEDAVAVFNSLVKPNLYSWSLLIKAYAKNGRGMEALGCFDRMQLHGIQPDRVTFVCALDACASHGDLEKGREIHAAIVDLGLEDHVVVGTAILNMYGKCGSVADAKSVFDRMPHKNVVSWSAMISVYAQNGQPKEALILFDRMHCQGIRPNQVTFVSALDACASLASHEKGEQIHAAVIQRGYELQLLVGTALVNMYGKCGSVENARKVFVQMPHRDVVLWNAMITAYAQNGHGKEALDLYHQMQCNGFKPSQITFVCALDACASMAALEKGQEIHAAILDGGFEGHVIVGNALINMYGKCRSLGDARSAFERMIHWNVGSWNAIIAACIQNGHSKEALNMFNRMQLTGFMPDEITLVCALDACTCLAALEKGKEIHAAIVQGGYEGHIIVATALMNMYGKCGSLDNAWKIFTQMPCRTLVSWNTMIAACGQNGHSKEALDLFNEMQHVGIKPDDHTCLSILAAFSHTGCVDDARHFFYSMSQTYGLTQRVEHYMCLLDILGRAGHLDEAEDLIQKIPFENLSRAWLCLLGACKVHGDLERGVRSASQVFKLDPENMAPYLLLSNLYAAAGR